MKKGKYEVNKNRQRNIYETVNVFCMTKKKNHGKECAVDVFCDLSHDSSSGQVMPKVCIFCAQSEKTRTQCSLQGRRTCVCCVHSGTKAWHRNKCTFGEQCRLTSGMKCCKGKIKDVRLSFRHNNKK